MPRIRGGDGDDVHPRVKLPRNIEELDLRPALAGADRPAVDKRDETVIRSNRKTALRTRRSPDRLTVLRK